ncbi:MAG: OB-fold nucleic acid binding domain-containing protein [Candidatus Thorarchaeota archaeon]
MMKRMTAVRASISDIVNGTYGEDNGAHVTSSFGVELRRVAIVGFVVSKFSSEPEEGKKKITSVTLDDGTDTIQINVWGEEESALLDGVKQDILALVIGKVRKSRNPKYEDNIYLVPEIVKEIKDPNYMALHLLERYQAILTRSGTSPDAPSDPGQQQLTTIIGDPSPTTVTGVTKQVLNFIELHASPEGVNVDDVVAFFEPKGKDAIDIQKRIFKLIEDGLIEEISPSRYLPANQ